MGHVITLAQQKGGAGKTTVASHLAQAWLNAKKDVAIIDLDPQRSLTRWAEQRAEEKGLTLLESRDWRAGLDIRDARKAHDIILVDCPGNADLLLHTAIRESDLVLSPCQPTALDIWATQTIIETCRKEGTPHRVLLNRVPPRGKATDLTIAKLKDAGADILKSRLGNRVAFAAGIFDGLTAFNLSRTSTATDETVALRKELDRLLKALDAA
ncbi:ParA family protein [Oceanomicrobium pacificus]|uniref:AAA family ATPase n=1 Tax=Oceanomicrobium pacificus TaxID=2692916 RepID=A0A6B0TUT8_9RHOB|nr:ParA family protein [Oceanomicrobium pacificus]MXU65348.1 AAA family ATPase [Oceanomicrobium pacificus]